MFSYSPTSMSHISQNKSSDYVTEFEDLGIKDGMTSLLRQTAVLCLLGRDVRNSASDGEWKCIQTVVRNLEGKIRPGRPRTR